MTTFTTTFAILRRANACASGYKTLAEHLGGVKKYGEETPIQLAEIVRSNGVADTLWVLGHGCPNIVESVKKRITVTFACDVAERVLGLFEGTYPKDDRPRKAIETARGWIACIEGPEQERAAAYAAYAADAAAAYAADAARYAAEAAAYAADAAAAARYAAYAADGAHAARYAAEAAAEAAADRAVYAADERDWQKNRLIELLEADK